MMMQCPRCSTRWRVAAASPVENPLFRCGRCHHLFRQFPGATAPIEAAPSQTRRTTPEEPDTLEFIFPRRQPGELSPAVVAAEVEAPTRSGTDPEADGPPIVPMTEPAELGLDDELTFAIDGPEPGHDALDHEREDVLDDVLHDPMEDAGPRLSGDTTVADEIEPSEDDGLVLGDTDEHDQDLDLNLDEEPFASDAHRTLHVEDTMRSPAGFGTIMRAIGTTVAGFVVLALVIRVAPDVTTSWLTSLPIAGASFAHDRNLVRKVELRNVNGRFQRLRNARRVFVISGDARNNSPLTIERIEVAGVLYGLGGAELDQRVVTTGNRTTLTDLSEAEIALLQNLDPAIALAPGETTPFLIVFLEPPREFREFSSRVLSVRPTRQASSPPPAAGHRGSAG